MTTVEAGVLHRRGAIRPMCRSAFSPLLHEDQPGHDDGQRQDLTRMTNDHHDDADFLRGHQNHLDLENDSFVLEQQNRRLPGVRSPSDDGVGSHNAEDGIDPLLQ